MKTWGVPCWANWDTQRKGHQCFERAIKGKDAEVKNAHKVTQRQDSCQSLSPITQGLFKTVRGRIFFKTGFWYMYMLITPSICLLQM